MAIQELLVKLTADNKDLKNKLKQSEADTKGFGNSMKQVGVMAVAAFAVAGAAVTAFMVSSFKAWEEQDKANKKLQASLKGNTVAFKELEKQAGQLQQQAGFGDELLMDIQSLAASSGKSAAEIKKLTAATAYLAKATGQDLRAAYLQVNGTLSGSAGRLGRLDAEFLTLTADQLKNGDAVDLVIQKYKDLAIASTTETERLSNNWGDFKENMGKVVAPALNAMFTEINSRLLMLNDSSVSFWESMTMPNWVYQDIQKQKAALENAGANAKKYYSSILGVGTVSGAMNQISGSITQLSGPTITKKGSDDNQKAKSEASNRALDERMTKIHELAKLESYLTITNMDMGSSQMDAMTMMGIATNDANSSLLGYRETLVNAAADAAILNDALNNLSESQVQALSDSFGVAASLFKEHTIAYKLFASAQAAIDTYKAANASYAAMAGIPVVGPALGAVAAGVAIAAGLANVAKINGIAFAEGGVVSGPTQALVGEYANAQSNPEVIAPLDKLKSIMGSQVQRVEVYGYIDGDVIRLANKRSIYLANIRG